MKIFQHWQIKLLSFILALLFYINLQSSKIVVKELNIPIEYPKLKANQLYVKNDKTYPIKVEGFKELLDDHARFMKIKIDPNDVYPGENFIKVNKIEGVPPNGINVTPLGGKIHVVVEKLYSKTVPLEVMFEDQPPEGYVKTNHFLKPMSIKITGPKNVLNNYNKYILGKISLKNQKSNFVRNIKINDLPDGVKLADKFREAQIKVIITKESPIAGEQTYEGLPVRCEGLNENLEAELSSNVVSIKFNSPVSIDSHQVMKGIKAIVPCYRAYDRINKRMIPNAKPDTVPVKIIKRAKLKNIEILNIFPDKITVKYKVKENDIVEEAIENEKVIDNSDLPEPPMTVPGDYE